MEYNNHIVTQRDGRAATICFMAHGGPELQPEFDANARLIAAAPELLAAAKDALGVAGAGFHLAGENMEALRRAIRKAETP